MHYYPAAALQSGLPFLPQVIWLRVELSGIEPLTSSLRTSQSPTLHTVDQFFQWLEQCEAILRNAYRSRFVPNPVVVHPEGIVVHEFDVHADYRTEGSCLRKACGFGQAIRDRLNALPPTGSRALRGTQTQI